MPGAMKPVVLLGSASARRHQVFRSLGIPFEVAVADVEEILDEEDPVRTAAVNARRKFEALRRGNEDRWLVTADTVVFVGGRCLGKPTDVEEGVRMLCSYSGGVQLVVTAMVFARPGGAAEARECVSSLRFGQITEESARAYLERFRTTDRAGSYDLESFVDHVAWVTGSYTSIRGIPEETVADWFAAQRYGA